MRYTQEKEVTIRLVITLNKQEYKDFLDKAETFNYESNYVSCELDEVMYLLADTFTPVEGTYYIVIVEVEDEL